MTLWAWELLDLAARWIHVIASIMWIGNSLLFIWLDKTLQPSRRGGEGMQGETWLLHSGGFYFVEKTQLVGQPLPHPLHWFKWQAYTTWISGAVLLLVVYYLGGRASLEDPAIASLSHGAAVAVGVATVLGGVAVYEIAQRAVAPRAPRVASAVLLLGFLIVVYSVTHALSGRAAFLHIGAMLASIMAGNVAMTIIPSQRDLVRSVTGGGRADPTISARAKRVSIYNNYIVFPVIALMVSGHFPALYAHRWNWILLLILVAGGATIRHALNIRFVVPTWRLRLAAAIAGTALALWALLALPAHSASGGSTHTDVAAPATVSFADARHVIDRRCGACHSMQPSDSTIAAP
ncbi:MAG: urate hydroxylase PuuD, partial [Gemmatimonadaceae bacterium]